MGKAYAFFDCSANYQEISAELPVIREMVETTFNLELSLHVGVEKLRGEDPQLEHIITEARDAGMRYAFKASLVNAVNKSVANELASILNQFYHSPLFREDKDFRGAVVFKERGRYVFRR